MYYKRKIQNKKQKQRNNDWKWKYRPIFKKETSIEHTGMLWEKQDILSINSNYCCVRSFGKKLSARKIQLIAERGKTSIITGPCLFSQGQLGIIIKTSPERYISLATKEGRREIEKVIGKAREMELKVGDSITQYHRLHLNFVRSVLECLSVNNTEITVVVPCVEYTTYLFEQFPSSIKKEYWEKVKEGSKKVEQFYKKGLKGRVRIIRNEEWPKETSDIPDVPKDVQSYINTYLNTYLQVAENSGNELLLVIEDLVEMPLLIKMGKRSPKIPIIGILGLLTEDKSLNELLQNQNNEKHPYLVH